MNNSNVRHSTHKQSRKPLVEPRKQQYTYHWDRIFGAFAMLLVLIGIAAYGIHAWLAPADQQGSEMVETPPEEAIAPRAQQPSGVAERALIETQDPQSTLSAEPPLAVDDPEQPPAESGPVETESLSPATSHIEEQTVAVVLDSATVSVETESVAVAQSTDEIIELPEEDELSQLETEIAEEFPEEQADLASDRADGPQTTAVTNSPFQLKELNIFEPRVKRFLLTKRIENKEPLGELGDIDFKADGSAAVWAYSEVVDKRGSRLKYVWLHDGNPIATVPINIRGDRWRSYSSKTINRTMSGTWRVELQDREGSLLASADFLL